MILYSNGCCCCFQFRRGKKLNMTAHLSTNDTVPLSQIYQFYFFKNTKNIANNHSERAMLKFHSVNRRTVNDPMQGGKRVLFKNEN